MNEYKEGTVFELRDGENYVIVDSLNKGEYTYVLSSPICYEDKKAKTDFSKMVLVKINDQTDDMEIETDERIIDEVIRNSVNKIKAQ